MDNLSEVYASVNGLCDAMFLVSRHFSRFLEWFTCYYIHFEHVAFHIVSNGFVNPVPTLDKSSNDENVGDLRPEEASGMGEGEGAIDVSDQIEETGQLDNLRVGLTSKNEY